MERNTLGSKHLQNPTGFLVSLFMNSSNAGSAVCLSGLLPFGVKNKAWQ